MKVLEIKSLLKESKIAPDKILYNEPMNRHTTFKIGGPADCFIQIDHLEELKEILKIANQNKIKLQIMGNGSNVLVLDKGIRGITLKLQLEGIEIQEQRKTIQVTVGAGEKLGKLARNLYAKRNHRIRRIIGYTRNHRRSYQDECRSPWKRNERYRKSSERNR